MIFKEVCASIYAWDTLDEGIEYILDTLERETLCNSIYLAALMHHEKRPLTDFYYPHNPRRKVYWTEDSRAYWRPDPQFYRDSRIKPRETDNPELRGSAGLGRHGRAECAPVIWDVARLLRRGHRALAPLKGYSLM